MATKRAPAPIAPTRPGYRFSDALAGKFTVHHARETVERKGEPSLGKALCGVPVVLLGNEFPSDLAICPECRAKLSQAAPVKGRVKQGRMGLA